MTLKTPAIAVFLAMLLASTSSLAEAYEAALHVEASAGGAVSGTPKSALGAIGVAPVVGFGAGVSTSLGNLVDVSASFHQSAAFGFLVPDSVAPIPDDTSGQTLAGIAQADRYISSVRLRVDVKLDLGLVLGDTDIISDFYVGAYAGPAFGVFSYNFLQSSDADRILLGGGQIAPDFAFGGLGGVAIGFHARLFDFVLDTEIRATAGFVGSPMAAVELVFRPAIAFYPFSIF